MSKLLDLLAAAHGQCRLNYISATQIRLDPAGGGRNLAIGGYLQRVPSAGVTVANTGLAANTTYYVYAYMASGVMTLELSATGHSTDATTGIEVKTGDITRTLVGMVRTNGSSQFQDTGANIGVLSWFNRRLKGATAFFTAARSTNSTTATELNSEIRVNFLCWGDDLARTRANGGIYTVTTGPATLTSASIPTRSRTAAAASTAHRRFRFPRTTT